MPVSDTLPTTMTQPHSASKLIPSTLCVLLVAFLLSAVHGQNQQPTPAPMPFAAQPQVSHAEQANFPPPMLDELSPIKAAALSDDYAYRKVAHLTENIGPRPSGSLQAKAAVDYVTGELRQIGRAHV